VKQGFRLVCFVVIVALASSARFVVHAQSQSSTVDPFVAQITSSRLNSVAPVGVNSYVNDISGNGRFAVIESNGDIATQNPDNADGNREIFLFDYAQRRIYQITHTRSARNDAARPFLTSANLPDLSNIRVEVNNVKPVIGAQPVDTGNNQLTYSIVFSSNATTPGNFDGDANSAALALDGNQEIWIYQLPPVSTTVNLSSGDDDPVDLSAGTFIRVTDTPASRRPQAGSATATPFVADDNRDVAVNDNVSIIAFASTRNNPTRSPTANGATNTDGNPEIFVFNRNNNATTQVTSTQGDFVFNDNPSLSADGTVLAFISNANITGNNNDDGKGNGNAEIYYARLNTSGGIVTAPTQATSTKAATQGLTVNILSPGRRLSRDGRFIAFESTSADPKANGAIQVSTAVFVYDIAGNSFQQYGPRAAQAGNEVFRFPVFTDYSNAGTSSTPSTLVFASRLSFRADGSAPTNSTDADSLNPNSRTQLFSVPLAAPTTFTRITNTPAPIVNAGTLLQPFASDTRRRIAFNIANTELGGGNADGSSEAFYLLTPPAATSDTQGLNFFTGASERPVTTGAASPSVAGLAPGMLALARSTNTLASSSKDAASGASESQRSPSLPIELNGVSIAVNGAAAGLYSIRPNQLNFVVPAGLAATTGTATYPVVVNNNGNLIRGTLQIVPAQPDIFTSTNGDGGRARAFLPNTMIGEPFTVSTAGDTLIAIFLTGVRNVMRGQVRVTVGSTDISGDNLICSANPTASATTLPCFNLDAPGMDQINVRLPGTLANAGDVPVIVTVTIGGQTFTSRPADTAPRILLR